MVYYRDLNGLSAPQIKKQTGVPTSTIRRIFKFGQARFKINLRFGRSSKLTPRDVRRLVRAVTSSADGRAASYVKLAKELEIEASEQTLRRALRKVDFRRCVACPKPLISWINRRKCLKWARAHLHWGKKIGYESYWRVLRMHILDKADRDFNPLPTFPRFRSKNFAKTPSKTLQTSSIEQTRQHACVLIVLVFTPELDSTSDRLEAALIQLKCSHQAQRQQYNAMPRTYQDTM